MKDFLIGGDNGINILLCAGLPVTNLITQSKCNIVSRLVV